MPSTIILVDDHPVFRQGLKLLLTKEKGLKVVGEADDGLMAVERVLQKCPDLVVMDISMPNLDGIEATRQIRAACPDTRVVALSVHSGKQFVRDMIEAGASGYILKESIPEEMVAAIRTVLSGDVYLSKSISNVLVRDYKTLISESQPEPDKLISPILHTKLHRPPTSADIVPRARLVELLEKGVQYPMTLISAPAGYGKSVTVSQWLEVTESPSAWVSLDESDNDPRMFLSYVLEAIQTVFPDNELQTLSLLGSANLPAFKMTARYLLNDLETLPQRFVLVIDDYHHIRNTVIHDLLMELLVHPSPHMHLALITRRDPPIALIALRNRGVLTEISAKDLRFSVAETKSFLERFLRIAVSQKTAQVLEEKVEGWVTGLHLAALSIRSKADQERLISGLKETSQYVRDYLIQEVLSHVPPQYKWYLLRTALPDRFCAPLCNALSSANSERHSTDTDTSGADFIHWLLKANLFVISLDAAHQWFRFHHLFQELLQKQLADVCSAGELAGLHTRASEWFESRGLIDEALTHALAAGDAEGAALIIVRQRLETINTDQWYLLDKWLAPIPEATVQRHPELLMTRAWVLLHHFRFDIVLPLVDQIEAMIAADPTQEPLRGEIALCRGYSLFFMGEGTDSLNHLDKALEWIPASYYEARAQTEVIFALSNQMVGRREVAIRSLDDLLLHYDSPQELRKTRLLITFVFIHFISGNLAEAEIANRRLGKMVEYGRHNYIWAWTAHMQGLIHLQRCEWESAVEHLGQSVEQRFIHFHRAAVDSITGLMLAYQALGKEDDAQATMQVLKDFVASFDDPALWALAGSSEVRLANLQGRPEVAGRWLETAALPPEGAMLWWLDVPSVTRCRALIAEGSTASLVEAEKQMGECAKLNETHHNTFQLIGIRALQAVVSAMQGKDEEAIARLGQALVLARPGGFLFQFFELGPSMKDLLLQLPKQDASSEYARMLLAALGDLEPETAPDGSVPTSHSPPLVEPLTHRELDVLELLAKRFQNKEIAEKLFVTAETVKGHLKNIYQKLAVSKRREAVEKARALGII